MFDTPGIFVDRADPGYLPLARQLGFNWIVRQTQNDTQLKAVDLTTYRRLGFRAGVWGVNYRQEDARRDMSALVTQAKLFGADMLVMNTEYAVDVRPLVEIGAGFPGPKGLITIIGVIPEMDLKPLADAGWFLLTEDYLNDQTTTTPAVAEFYAQRAGFPSARLNHTLGMYEGDLGKVPSGAYVTKMREAGVGRRFSLYMGEHTTEEDYRVLGNYISSLNVATPTPAQGPTARETRATIEAAASTWAAHQRVSPDPRTRLEIIRRIAGTANTDARWDGIRARVLTLLDQAGVPR